MFKLISFIRFGLIALLAIFVLWFVLVTDKPHVRYSGYICQYRAIYDYTGDVDIAVFGTSRMQEAANASFMAQSISKKSGVEKPVIYDLSRSGWGHGHVTQFAKDILTERKVKFVLIEFKNEETASTHPRFGETVTWSRLLTDMRYKINVGNIGDRWGKYNLNLGQARERIVKRFFEFTEAGPKYFNKPFARKSQTTADCSPRLGTFPDPVGYAAWKKKYADWETQPAQNWDIKTPYQKRANDYTRDIISQAREAGTTPIFIYVPRSHEPALSEALINDFESEFGEQLLQFDPASLKDSYARGFVNRSHMGPAGQRIFADWLANELEDDF